MDLFIDIETIKSPRTDLPEFFKGRLKHPATMSVQKTIDNWWANKSEQVVIDKVNATSLSGSHGEIISISWALGDADVSNVFRPSGMSEKNLLSEFELTLSEQLSLRKVTKWIGSNVAEFDLPFMFKRFIVNGVSMPPLMPINPKPWAGDVFDVTGVFSGKPHGISQDELCFILGIEQKPSDINGANVGQHYIDGNYGKIVDYNNYDVETVRKIYKRMKAVL